ncbi:MAG: hypothetical protein U0Q18_22145 [Bryobacteraceae bacterium]
MARKTERLLPSEHVIPGKPADNQTCKARWEFIKALRSNVPLFFESLRDEVFPHFARVLEVHRRPTRGGWRTACGDQLPSRYPGRGVIISDGEPCYYRRGWDLPTWEVHADPNCELRPVLIKWAESFNIRHDQWILEGALQVLSDWHRQPDCRHELDVWGLRPFFDPAPLALPKKLPESRFEFQFRAWDPQYESRAKWHASLNTQFKAAVNSHLVSKTLLMQRVNAKPANSRYSPEHFVWLALYKCGGAKLDSLPGAQDYSVKYRGILAAAKLANVTVPRRHH